MLFGCCVNLLPESDEPAGIGYAKHLARLGYDYIELPLNKLMALSQEDFLRVRSLLKDSGLPCRCCNDFMPASFQITGPETTPWTQLSSYLSEAFSRLEMLETPYAVFGSPWSRSCPPGFPAKDAFRQIASFLREAGKLAGEHRVTIAIEHNNHTETNMLNHFSDALSMAMAADHPNIQVLCDYYHLRVEGDSPREVLAGAGRIVHTHIAKLEKRRYLADTAGELPWLTEYAAALRSIGYAGGISIEAFSEKKLWESEARECLRVLRETFS